MLVRRAARKPCVSHGFWGCGGSNTSADGLTGRWEVHLLPKVRKSVCISDDPICSDLWAI